MSLLIEMRATLALQSKVVLLATPFADRRNRMRPTILAIYLRGWIQAAEP